MKHDDLFARKRWILCSNIGFYVTNDGLCDGGLCAQMLPMMESYNKMMDSYNKMMHSILKTMTFVY